MNKILRYSFIALLAFICNVSFAGESTIDFTKLSITKTTDGYTLTSGDFTFAASKANGSNTPTQNGSAKDLRHYAKNTLTISGAKITRMVFSMSAQGKKQWANITASVGNLTIDKTAGTTTWENADGASSVVLTVGATNDNGSDASKTAGQFDLNSVVITSDGQAGETPTPEVQTVENIAAFKALETGTTAILKLTNAVVLYKNEYTSKSSTNTELYVRDATGAIQFFNTGLNLSSGQLLNGTVEVKYAVYNGMPEATKTANTSEDKLTTADADDIVPTEVTVADLTTDKYLCDWVKVKDVELTQETTTSTTDPTKTFTNNYMVSGDDKVMIYDKFKKGITLPTSGTYTLEGILVSAKLSNELVNELAPTSAPISTGINNISADDATLNAPAYNLAGQKVNNSYKGVVIKAGKKFIQK